MKDKIGTPVYDASSIQVLKGLEAVRLRPAMYIGDTGKRGLHHLVWEVLDNSVDEAMAGHCDTIHVTVENDGRTITIEDNGRGIPVDEQTDEKRSALEVVLTVLHAGGKFGGSGYTAAGGLHGVGVSCVNALSWHLTARVWRDGGEYTQSFKQGAPQGQIQRVGDSRKHGTSIQFRVDGSIFRPKDAQSVDNIDASQRPQTEEDFKALDGVEHLLFDDALLERRFRETAFLNGGLKIVFHNKRTGKNETYQYSGGISDYVEYLTDVQTGHYPSKPFFCEKRQDKTMVQVSFQYTEADSETLLSFANNINTHDGGTHLSGFKTAFTRVVNAVGRKNGNIKDKDTNLNGDDIREGMTAVISVRLPQPQFEGQTKTKLGSPDMDGIVQTLFGESLNEFFEKNPAIVKMIVERAQLNQRAREAAKKSAETIKKTGASKIFANAGKLKPCRSRDNNITELFIVEGDSAAGCMSANTLIKTTDNKPITLKQMVDEQTEGKRHFVFTILNDGSVGIEEAINARLTKKNAQLVKVTLDNGDFEICTPCHPFMLRDGTYTRADALQPGASLMPCYSQMSTRENNHHNLIGYEMIKCPKNNKWVMAHALADDWNIKHGVYTKESGHVRHHTDFCKLNNNPINIVRMNKDEHFKLHSEHLEFTLHRPDVKAKSKVAKQTSEFRAKQSKTMKECEVALEILAERNKKQWSDPKYVDYMVQCWKNFCAENPEYVAANQNRLNEAQKEYWASEENRQQQSERTKSYFENNPEHRLNHQQKAVVQWDNEELRNWRAEKTSKQWTDEFRKSRQNKLDTSQYQRVLKEVSDYVYENKVELTSENRPLIPPTEGALYQRYARWCNKYFDGDKKEANNAALCYNHRVVSVEHLDYTEDVYDLEVPNTHNFALASGVFVHNSAKDGRDSGYQAVLPIRGKIINAEKKDLLALLKNKEIESLVTAIGVGIQTSGSDTSFNLNDRKYSKIILMTDADVDGSHIATLLLTFFYRYMRPLVEGGFVYLVQPPLYRVDIGSKQHYCWSEAERLKALNSGSGKAHVTRFKGLGEMDEIELGATTMFKGDRRLIQVSIEDAADADRMLSVLMGKDVSARKAHIIEHSKKRALIAQEEN